MGSDTQRAVGRGSAVAWLLLAATIGVVAACGDRPAPRPDVSAPLTGRIAWAVAARYFSYADTRGGLPCGIYYDALPGFTGVATFVGTLGGGSAGQPPAGRAFIVSPLTGDRYRYRLFLAARPAGDGTMRVQGREQGGVLIASEVDPEEAAKP